MRTRQGNPHNEAHGRAMRVYDWVAPAGTTIADAVDKMEAAVPGLALRHRPGQTDGGVHGYVNTSVRPDGSVYVCVHLYDEGCDDPNCAAGHGAVKHARGPDLDENRKQAMKGAVGEHPAHKLGRGRDADRAVLRNLGFEDAHGPLKDDE